MNASSKIIFVVLKALYLTIVLALAAAVPALVVGQAGETLVVASMKYIKNPNPLKQETWYD